MSLSFANEIARIATIDIFKRNSVTGNLETGIFIGRPFFLDYDRAHILVADAWKQKVKGIPQGSFLLAYYENEEEVSKALLLRVLRPAKLPTDSDVISSMIEYYKDGLKTSGKESKLDSFTRYEFSFSALECRTLGTFYKDERKRMKFGADVENFYSSHNYSVIKPGSGSHGGGMVKSNHGDDYSSMSILPKHTPDAQRSGSRWPPALLVPSVRSTESRTAAHQCLHG